MKKIQILFTDVPERLKVEANRQVQEKLFQIGFNWQKDIHKSKVQLYDGKVPHSLQLNYYGNNDITCSSYELSEFETSYKSMVDWDKWVRVATEATHRFSKADIIPGRVYLNPKLDGLYLGYVANKTPQEKGLICIQAGTIGYCIVAPENDPIWSYFELMNDAKPAVLRGGRVSIY